MRVIAASDRSDNFVIPWIMRTRYMEATPEELGVIPHALVRLDRLLVEALKNILDRHTDLYRTIVHEGSQSLERNQTQLTSLQIMHTLVITFTTSASMTQLASHMEVDGPSGWEMVCCWLCTCI